MVLTHIALIVAASLIVGQRQPPLQWTIVIHFQFNGYGINKKLLMILICLVLM